MGEWYDDMSAQGIAGGLAMERGFRFGPPHHPHECPGCSPRSDDPLRGEKWDKWHVIERKWLARGESSACPILRGETLPPVVAQARPTLPHPSEAFAPWDKGRTVVVVEATTLVPVAAPAEARAPVQRTTRKAKVPSAPKGQSSLF
jgi:hypothetical protein